MGLTNLRRVVVRRGELRRLTYIYEFVNGRLRRAFRRTMYVDRPLFSIFGPSYFVRLCNALNSDLVHSRRVLLLWYCSPLGHKLAAGLQKRCLDSSAFPLMATRDVTVRNTGKLLPRGICRVTAKLCRSRRPVHVELCLSHAKNAVVREVQEHPGLA